MRFCVGWAGEFLAAILLKNRTRYKKARYRHRGFGKLFSKRRISSF